MDKERIQVPVTTPLMNEYLEEYPDAKRIIEMLHDEDSLYDLRLLIDNADMIPTAVGLALSKRHNVEYYAKISRFPGSDLVFGFLKSSYFKEVEFVENV